MLIRSIRLLLFLVGCVRPLEVVPSYEVIKQSGIFCSGRDSCQQELTEAEATIDWKKRNCFCDESCATYGDCCIDAPAYKAEEQSENHLDFGCVSLKQYGGRYMKQTCSDSWPTDQKRALEACESLPVDGKDPVGSMPVTSATTGITYRNYFCAVCNHDFRDVEFWQPRLECPTLAAYANRMENKSLTDIADMLRFDQARTTWGIDVNFGGVEEFHECSVDPSRPEGVEVRPCVGEDTVATCPEAYVANDTVKALCVSYTAVVFDPWTSYRNVHCAMCNNATILSLICLNVGPFGRFNWKQNFYSHAFSVLFDIGGDVRDAVGYVGTHCETGQFYDPFFKKCRNVICDDGSIFTDKLCQRQPTTSLPINGSTEDQLEVEVAIHPKPNETASPFETCPKFYLDLEEFQRINESTVYVSRYGLQLSEGEYSIDDKHLVVCAIAQAVDGLAKFDDHMGQVTLICLGISMVCLAIHLAVSLIIPELHNLNGKNLMSLSAALFGAYSSFMAIMFVDRSSVGSAGCLTVASFVYFFFMSSFFWMFVIAFDVYKTLKLSTTRLRLTTGHQWKRFAGYCLIGWIGPLALVATALAIDHMEDAVPQDYRPGFGDNGLCWFSQKKALLVYFAGPFAGVMAANLCLFASASYIIFDATRKSKQITTSSSKTNFYIYVRLAVIMGLTWSTGLVAGLIDVSWLWYLFIALNTLQGLFIFASFTCTKKVLNGLKEKVNRRRTWNSTTFSLRWSTKDSTTTKRSQVFPASFHNAEEEVGGAPSRYGTRGGTMYTVSKQQASSSTQNSFDGRYI